MSRRLAPSRIVLGLAVLSATGLAAAAIIHFPDLERVYHLRALREEPGLFAAMLASPRPAKRAAAREFTKERAGKEALLALFLDRMQLPGGTIQHLKGLDRLAPREGALLAGGSRRIILEWTVDGLYRGNHSSAEGSNLMDEVLDLLSACDGEVLRQPGLNLEFLIEDSPRPHGTIRLEELKEAIQLTERPGRPPVIVFFRKPPPASP